ncbi:hypothetical protein GOODEAATRI_028973, partial [Goodea atripinnis]
ASCKPLNSKTMMCPSCCCGGYLHQAICRCHNAPTPLWMHRYKQPLSEMVGSPAEFCWTQPQAVEPHLYKQPLSEMVGSPAESCSIQPQAVETTTPEEPASPTGGGLQLRRVHCQAGTQAASGEAC